AGGTWSLLRRPRPRTLPWKEGCHRGRWRFGAGLGPQLNADRCTSHSGPSIRGVRGTRLHAAPGPATGGSRSYWPAYLNSVDRGPRQWMSGSSNPEGLARGGAHAGSPGVASDDRIPYQSWPDGEMGF